MFRSYINYLKIESEQVKRFHSALWAGVFTGVFACIYVYTLYGIAPPMPLLDSFSAGFENKTEYSRKDSNQVSLSNTEANDLDQKSQINTQNSTQSPFAALKSFWHDAVDGVSNLKTK